MTLGVYYGNGTKEIRKHQSHTEAPNQPLSDFPLPQSCPQDSDGNSPTPTWQMKQCSGAPADFTHPRPPILHSEVTEVP